MNIVRQSYSLSYRLLFPRPSVGLAAQSAKIVESIVEALGEEFPPKSRDIKVRAGGSLDDWLLQIYLFNYLGRIELTVDGLKCTFERLLSDADLLVIMEVVGLLTEAVATYSPAQRYSVESVSGSVNYSVVDGKAARDEYFSKLTFSELNGAFFDAGIKGRLRHLTKPAVGTFEVSPTWTNHEELFFWFDVDLMELKGTPFKERATIANELVVQALGVFNLLIVEKAPT